jgi:hypothetical protein
MYERLENNEDYQVNCNKIDYFINSIDWEA